MAMIFIFECWILSQFFHSPRSLSPRGSSAPLRILLLGWCHLHIWGYWYFSLQSWVQLVLHPVWYFARCTLHTKQAGWQYTVVMHSFPNLEPVCRSKSGSNCCFLPCIQVSQEAGKVVWYSHLLKNFPQFVVIHTVKGFSVVNEADVFLKLSCFFDDPADVGNLISGCSAFSKTSLNMWKLTVHVLLKPGLENFEHYFTSMWVQLCGSLSILWHCLSLGMEWKLTFSSPMATGEFSKYAGILSAVLSQHHLSRFEIAPLEFRHLH